MIKLVLFDIDNTLVNHTGAQNSAISWINRKFFKEISDNDFKEKWLKYSALNWRLYEKTKLSFREQQEKRVQDVWSEYNLSLDRSKAREVFELYYEKYKKAWSLLPNREKLLKQIKCNKGVLSNGNRTQQLQKLKQLGIKYFFKEEYIFISEDIGFAKPNMKIFEHVEKKTNLDPKEILYIGDKLHIDILPAKQRGWNTIWFDYSNFRLDKKDNHSSLFNDVIATISFYEKHNTNY